MNGETTLTMPVAPTGGYGNMGGFGFGQDWIWLIVLFLFGWNNGGWGGFGGGMNGGVGSEVQRGFDHSAVVTKLDGVTTGLADLGFALNNTAVTGFSNAELSAANRQAALMQQLFGMQSASQNCCCETQRQIERGFCDTQNTINGSTQAILNKLSQMDYNNLNDKYLAAVSENQVLKTQNYIAANQDAQTAELIRRLAIPSPVPAYQVPNPYAGYGYGCNPCGCA